MLLSNWLKTFANRLRTPRRSQRVSRRDVQRSQQVLLREVNNQVMCSSSSEVLEDRTLLAFDLMISATASAGVSIDDAVANQRTITATATGANIAVADVLAGFTAGRSVFISNGSTGAEAGNIIWNTALDYNGIATTRSLTINTDASSTTASVNLNQSISDSTPGGELLHVAINAHSGVTLSGANADVTTGGGAFTVDADSDDNGSGTFTSGHADSAVSSSGGTISITASDVALTGTLVGTSSVTFVPSQTGRAIALGTEVGGQLSLTDAELDRVAVPTLQIGGSNTGPISVSAAINRPASTAMTLTSTGTISFNGGSISTGGGALSLNATIGISPASSGVDVDTGASSVTLGRDLYIDINGTTVDAQYNQLNVTGLVNLNAQDLIITGSHIPTVGQMFTIVENDSTDLVSGTFNGLPQGASIANFLDSGLAATISYTGGTGNDVVLTVVAVATTNTYLVDILADENDGNFAAGDLSLREAITLANASPGADLIRFNTVFTNGPGLHTIRLTSALPSLTGPVIIDGTSQPGYQGTPLINVNGNSTGNTIFDVSHVAAIGTAIKGLKLSGFTGVGIRVNSVDLVRLEDLDMSDAANNYNQIGISIENGSDNVVITGVNVSGMNSGGIRVANSNSPTIQNNALNRADVSSIGALYLTGVLGMQVGAISGNTFTGSAYGIRIDNSMSGLVIGDSSVAGAHIRIEDGTSGLNTVTSQALYLTNVDYATVDNVDLSYSLISRAGEGIRADSNSDYLTIRNNNLTNRSSGIIVTSGRDLNITNNNLTNNSQAISASNVTRDQQAAAVLASGNVFTNSTNVFSLTNITGTSAGLTIGASGTNIVLDAASGITSATGTVVNLANADNVTITGVNMGYAGISRSGSGITTSSADNLVITGNTITSRSRGIEINGGTDPIIINNNLSNAGTALYVDSATDGIDANIAAMTASGNTFNGSGNALDLRNLTGMTIGTMGTEAVVVAPATDGLRTATGTVFNLNNLPGLAIEGMDLSYLGVSRSGAGLIITNAGSNLLLQNFTVNNRSSGIQVTTGTDLTVRNNDLSSTDNPLYVSTISDGGDTDTFPALLSGNRLSGSVTALHLLAMNGLTIGTTGTEAVVINNATDGLQSATTYALRLQNDSNMVISGLDLSYSGAGRSGTGIYSDGTMNNLTITGVTATNRGSGFRIGDAGTDLTLTNNNLSNNNDALYISNFSDGVDGNTVPVVASGNLFWGTTREALQIYNLNGQYIGTSGTGFIIDNTLDGLNSTPYIAIHTSNMPNSTFDGLDLSYPGSDRFGYGLFQSDNFGANVTVQNVTSTNRQYGFYMPGGGQDLTLLNNNVSNNTEGMLIFSYSDGTDVGNTVPIMASGNVFTNSRTGLHLHNMTGQYIGTSGTGFLIDNATAGITTASSMGIYLRAMTNLTIDGVDLSWAGGSRSGIGIYADQGQTNLTIQNVTATNRGTGVQLDGGGSDLTLNNNNLSNNTLAMRFYSFSDGGDANTVPIQASGNIFTGSGTGIEIHNTASQFVGSSGTGIIINNAVDGLNTTSAFALYLRTMSGLTIDGLDLSYTGGSRTGNGIYADQGQTNLTIQNVTATNRNYGIQLDGGGTDLTLTNGNLSNNNTGLRLISFSDGGDVNTVPVVASGNLFASSTNGIYLNNLPSQFIGTSGTGFIIDNATAGLQTVPGIALQVSNLDNSTINGLDVSWAVNSTHTGTGIYSDANSDNITITGVAASNRVDGVRIDGGSSLNINNSTFSNNTTGVISNSVTTSSLINNNIIQANTIGLQAQVGGTQVNATNNFWGSAAGPGAGGNNGFINNANATPFLASSPGGAPAVPAYPPAPPSLVSGPPTVLTVTSNTDVSDGTTTSIATLLANHGADGVISLREAIIAANNTAGTDTISFAIGTGAATIVLGSALPTVSGTVVFDGYSQPGFVGLPLITLDATALGVTALAVTAQNSVLKGFHIANGTGTALALNGANGTRLERTTLSGSAVTGTGLAISGSTNVFAQDLTINNLATGIQIGSSSSNVLVVTSAITGNTTGVSVDATTTGVTFNQDRIEANGAATAINNAAAVSMNARFNYWGAGGGAGAGGNNGVTGSVDTSNFLSTIPEGITASTLTVNTADDRSDGTTTSIAALIASPGADGRISLREAMTAANNTVGADTILFAIGSGVQTIKLSSVLPISTDALIINGASQAGFSGGPLITLDANGLTGNILEASNSALTLSALTVTNYAGQAVRLSNTDDSLLTNLNLANPSRAYLNDRGVNVESGSDNVVLQNIITTGTNQNGIRVDGSNNPTIQNNTLNESDTSGNGALYLSSVTGIAAGAISGNTFTGSWYGLRIDNGMSNLVIGDASVATAHIRIEDGTSGMRTVTSRALYLNNVDFATIDNVDLGYAVNSRVGEGIRADSDTDYLTVRNSNLSNRSTGIIVTGGKDLALTNNILANTIQAISISGVTRDVAAAAILASGNVFTNSVNVLSVSNLTGASAGLTIGTSGTNIVFDAASGVTTATGTIINLSNADNVLITGVNLGYAGGGSRSGVGINAGTGSDNLMITGNTIANRSTGVLISGGTDPRITGNDLLNSGTALYVDGATDGGDTDTMPMAASGNTFTKSNDALRLWNMTGMSIGITGTEAVVINNASDGLQTVTGTVFYLRLQNLGTVDGLNLGYTGTGRSGIGILADTNMGTGVTIQNVNATNRTTGIALSGGGTDLTVRNNDLSNNGTALYVSSFADGADTDSFPVSLSDNKFTGSATALQLYSMSGVMIGTTATAAVVINNATDGLPSATSVAVRLQNMNSLTIDGLDLGYTGIVRSGTGILADGTMNNLTVQNVIATNRATGLQLGNAGQDLTLTNNNLSNNNLGLYLNAFSDGSDANTVPVVATGNTFTGSASGIELYNMSNQRVAASGTGIIVASTEGLQTTTGIALRLQNMNGLVIDGLDLAYSGIVRSGFGVYADGTNSSMTIQNVVATNRGIGFRLGDAGQDLTLTNNNLSNNNLALYLSAFSDGGDANTVPIVATGNTFTGSASGIEFYNMSNQRVATSGTGIIVAATDGLKDSTGIALRLQNMTGLTIDGVDLAYNGAVRVGYGVYADGTNNNLKIQNVVATNRGTGFRIGDGGQDLKVLNNNLSNNDQALYILQYSDGDPAIGWHNAPRR